ncbi:MAG: prepilin-type N-terminal cleavage/methylation domain-containing protein [bacterium]|nr:prepilin-type N-terminal cleavage/methylation domain-containing protein [bacterium]
MIKAVKLNERNGFTLIEILVSVVIFTIAMLMSAGSVIMSARMRDRVEGMREVQDETRFVGEFINREVQSASNVVIVKPVDVVNCKGVSVFCDTIKITRLDIDGNTTIIETINPTVNSRSIEMTVEKSTAPGVLHKQIISSDKVFLRKLRFIPVYTGADAVPPNDKFAIKVEMSMEEARYSKLGNFNSGNSKLLSVLARPSKIELRFIASNISNIEEI